MIEGLAAVCLLIGAWIAFKSVRAMIRGVRSRSWPVVTGVIKAVRVVESLNSKGRPKRRQEVEYSYTVEINGRREKFHGTRERFGVPRKLNWTSDRSWVPLQRGEHVDVVYSPFRPSVSALQHGFSPFAILSIVIAGVMIWMGIELLRALQA